MLVTLPHSFPNALAFGSGLYRLNPSDVHRLEGLGYRPDLLFTAKDLEQLTHDQWLPNSSNPDLLALCQSYEPTLKSLHQVGIISRPVEVTKETVQPNGLMKVGKKHYLTTITRKHTLETLDPNATWLVTGQEYQGYMAKLVKVLGVGRFWLNLRNYVTGGMDQHCLDCDHPLLKTVGYNYIWDALGDDLDNDRFERRVRFGPHSTSQTPVMIKGSRRDLEPLKVRPTEGQKSKPSGAEPAS